MTPDEVRARIAPPLNHLTQEAAATLHKVVDEVENEVHAATTAVSGLIERAPDLTREAMTQIFETAAVKAEATAEALMQMTLERIAELKHTAATLRELGTVQAASVERAANFAKDTAALFADHAAKVTAFRDASTAGAKAA